MHVRMQCMILIDDDHIYIESIESHTGPLWTSHTQPLRFTRRIIAANDEGSIIVVTCIPDFGTPHTQPGRIYKRAGP